jgi:hypothetical protein
LLLQFAAAGRYRAEPECRGEHSARFPTPRAAYIAVSRELTIGSPAGCYSWVTLACRCVGTLIVHLGSAREFDDLVRLAAPGSRQRLVGLNMSFPSSSRPFSITNLLGRFH